MTTKENHKNSIQLMKKEMGKKKHGREENKHKISWIGTEYQRLTHLPNHHIKYK